MTVLSRRGLLRAAPLAAAFTLGGALARPARAGQVLRMGYQKGETILVAAKAAGTLERRFGPLGWDVTWTEFQYGPPMLEAMRTGAIDFGAVGDTPPVFVQAGHGDLVYVAGQQTGSEAVLLPPGSAIRTLAELKGKRVAFSRGSAAHWLLLRALEKAGLHYDQIQPVMLGPADAGAAFETGAVDAWSIWDPYYALFEARPGVRTLATDQDLGGMDTFVMGRGAFVRDNPAVAAGLVAALRETGDWARAHRAAVADTMAASTGLDRAAVGRMIARAPLTVTFMTPALTARQQHVADVFQSLRLIPAPIQVADVVWQPPGAADTHRPA